MSLGEQTPFVPGPLHNAGNIPLSESSSGQPIMGEAIMDWFRPLTIGVITSEIQGSDDPTLDGQAVAIERDVRTQGCVQAGDPERIQILPEGERSWQSNVMHTTPDFDVDTDTVIRLEGIKYRITESRDFSVNGYMRYVIVQDYEPAA